MSEALLIAARVRILRENLERVQRVLEAITESREPVQAQRTATQDAELLSLIRLVRGLSADVRRAGEMAETNANDAFLAAVAAADSLYAAANNVLARLDTLGKELSAPLSRRTIDLEELTAGINAGALMTGATETLRQLDAVDEKVAQAIRSREAGDEAKALTLFATAWQKLAKATETSDGVFREYVEFLSGIALRETGFDRGLCRIADEFVRELENKRDWPWTSWTIPAQREVREVTMARIIRLGFPEWSVWAIPLAAHEFAHLALDSPRFAELVARDIPNVRVLLADIFAATVAGPAYACALFTIRLQPPSGRTRPAAASGRVSPQLDMARAHVTLRAIASLDDPEAGLVPTEFVRTRLAQYWSSALAWIQPDPSLSEGELQQLDDLVDATRRKIGSDSAFPMGQWSAIEGWADQLIDERGADIRPVRDFTDEVRIVVNALWLARLRADQDDLGSLAEAGRDLAERIIAVSRGAGDAGGTGPAERDAQGPSKTPSGEGPRR